MKVARGSIVISDIFATAVSVGWGHLDERAKLTLFDCYSFFFPQVVCLRENYAQEISSAQMVSKDAHTLTYAHTRMHIPTLYFTYAGLCPKTCNCGATVFGPVWGP